VRGGLWVAGACAVVAVGVAPAVARPRSARTVAAPCPPKHTGVTAKTARVVVYARQTGIDSDSGGALTTYYACLRPAGRSIAVGHSAASGGEYPGDVEMQNLEIAGTFLTDESADGFASAAACGKYDPSYPCSSLVKYWVELVDVAARRKVKVPTSGPVSSLALSPVGAAAWVVSSLASSSSGSSSSTLYGVVVHFVRRGLLSARAEVIDTGQSITSVSFSGSSLRWSNTGQRKRRTLH
jgi:hypothetical protein